MKFITAIASVSALLCSSAAQAASNACVSRQQIAAMSAAFLPSALRASRHTCGPLLPNSAYLRSQESEVRLARADVDAEKAQALAMEGLRMIGGKDLPKGVSDKTALTMMSEMAADGLNKKLDAKSCAALDEVFYSTRSMSSSEVGTFIGTMLALIIGGDKDKLPVCKI